VEEFDRWDDAYAAQMRRVHYNFPNDHDVMALFVEALIMRTPRGRIVTEKAYHHFGLPRPASRGADMAQASFN